MISQKDQLIGLLVAVILLLLIVLAAPLVGENPSENQQVYATTQNKSAPVSADDRIADYNFWLTVITAVLAGVSFIQIYFLQRSDETARISAEAARELTRLAIKRPWVFVSGVHNLQIKPAKEDGKREPLTTPLGRVFVEYAAANHGEAPAIIEEVFCDLMIVTEAYKPQVARREHQLMISPILGPGETASIKEFLPRQMLKPDGGLVVDLEEGTTVPAPDIPDGQELFFWIIVRYRGISTAGHETSALWRFEKNVGLTFMQTGGEERNYAK